MRYSIGFVSLSLAMWAGVEGVTFDAILAVVGSGVLMIAALELAE